MKFPTDWKSEYSQKPLCGVLSTAIIAGISLAEAEKILRKHMPSHRKRWTGTTYVEQRKAALQELGFHVQEWHLGRITLSRAVTQLNQNYIYMINVTGHVVTNTNYMIADQSGICDIDDFWGKRKFVKDIWRVK